MSIMSPMSIEQYTQLRDAMLLKRNPDALIAFLRRHRLPVPSSRASAEVALHKSITGVQSLPLQIRQASKQWLTARGYYSLDDGEL
jgi:hypothetical protein